MNQATYRKHKAALTRATNSKDPLKVLTAVEKAYTDFDTGFWPDDWHRWNIALGDAHSAYRREGHDDSRVLARFRAAMARA